MQPSKKGRSAGQALWPAAKAFGQKTRRVALMLHDPTLYCYNGRPIGISN